VPPFVVPIEGEIRVRINGVDEVGLELGLVEEAPELFLIPAGLFKETEQLALRRAKHVLGIKRLFSFIRSKNDICPCGSIL
jgi:hypothetical protein